MNKYELILDYCREFYSESVNEIFNVSNNGVNITVQIYVGRNYITYEIDLLDFITWVFNLKK